MAKEITRGLAASGVTIVSGMAIGIDSYAHRATLEVGGRTVAVLGCGVDVCYPSSNRPLYELLTSGEHGAVISEYLPGTKPDTWRFPARNRIISGLSHGLVVIEAGQTSGSLITADLAFHGGKQVFALPGRVDAPMSEGTNFLISSNKAQLICRYEEVMNHLEWAHPSQAGAGPPIVELYGREKEVYEMLTNEPVHFDFLCERTGMTAGELSATLTMLELASVVTRHPGDWYSRS
jgi:DNA processing protein